MLHSFFPHIAKPINEYEKDNWGEDIKERGKLMRRVVNPHRKPLLVYYPANMRETIFSRYINAHTQISIDNHPEREPRRQYKDQWLNVIDYCGDACKMIPPEVLSGIDVLIDKCGIHLDNEPILARKLYDFIKPNGFLITDKEPVDSSKLGNIDFDFEIVLPKKQRKHEQKGMPFHLSIYQKVFN